MIIYFHSVKKEYFTKTIFSGIKLKLYLENGSKTGIVAKNGEGKTTLLKLISAQDQPDAGNLKIEPKRTKTFYLSVDHIEKFKGNTDEFLLSVNTYLYSLKQQLNDLSVLLEDPISFEKYSNLLDKYENDGGYQMENQINNILIKLKINDKSTFGLSGGEKSKLILGAIQIIEADLVLLDEPTNHLDITSLQQLEDFIINDKKTYLIISHDQKFLDNVTTRTISIQNHKLIVYEGNYSSYKKQYELDQSLEFDKYKSTQKEINRLEDLSKSIIKRNQEGLSKVVVNKDNIKNKKFTNTQGIRLKVAPDKDKMAANYFNQKLESKMRDSKIVKRRIDRIEVIRKPKKDWGIKVDFNESNKNPDIILKTQNIEYEISKDRKFVFPDITLYKDQKIALIGSNGVGKSTLAKIITHSIKDFRGVVTIPNSVIIGYYSQTHEILNLKRNALENLLNLDFIEDYNIPIIIEARNYLHQMLFNGDMVKQKVSELSQGEKSKLSLAKIIYAKPSFLLLDEPTNHLDIISKERIEEALKQYTGAMLIISHDRYFMESINVEKYITIY